MPTKKPRITITLTERQHEVLQSISSSSGQPMAGIVTEVLEEIMPIFEKMAVTFQHLKNAKNLEKAKFTQALDDAHSAFEPLVAETADQFDLFLGKIERAAGPAARGARAVPGRPKAKPDPLTNRGVTTSGEKGPKPKGRKGLQSISESPVFKKVSALRQHKSGGVKP